MEYDRPDEYIPTFTRKNGKVLTKMKPRFRPTGKTPDYSSKFAKSAIQSQIRTMKDEIASSERGMRGGIGYGKDAISWHQKSSFPSYMREMGINSKKDFAKIVERRKGKRFERIKKEAIRRLNEGYENPQGQEMPDMEFRVKTKQVFDNKDVIFRRVRGRIVPIKVSKRNRYDLLDEAPF